MKSNFKRLYLCCAAAVTLVMAFSLTSCKDDDKPSENVLSGTSWTVLTDSSNEWVGLTLTFNSNGNVSFSGFEYEDEGFDYAKWTYNNDVLKIVLGDEGPDDYVEGNFVITGDKATYTYSWYDYDGEWGGEDTYVMTLSKK